MERTLDDKLNIICLIEERANGGETLTAICKDFGISDRTYRRWKSGVRNSNVITLPDFPDSDIPVEDIIKQRKEEFKAKFASHKFMRWYPIKVNLDTPIAISFIGDPHLDSDGCNWENLEKDIRILSNTEHMFAVGIGDYLDNWIGRLERLYANSNISKSRALKLLEWFIVDSGISWMSLIAGNHDQWSGADSPLKFICKQHGIHILDSINRFELQFANGRRCKIDARHDFKGHSMWNSLHALQKAAHMKEPANIYVAGHKHNWATHCEESASRDFIYHLIRVRGYKHIDSYAVELGHDEQEFGSSVTAIIDPRVPENHPSFVTVFVDMQKAADYLEFLKSKA